MANEDLRQSRHIREQNYRRPARGVLCGVAILLALACGGDQADRIHAETPGEGEPAPAAAPEDQASPQEPADLSPVSSREVASAPSDVPAVEGDAFEARGAFFTLPSSWTAEVPSSAMRLAQASIPGSGGPAQLTVFHFGVGGGGGVESNLERWVGQVEMDPGVVPLRDTFSHGDFTSHWVDVQGTIKPSTMGVGPTTPQPGSRLLGGVVEGPGGPWFFKATGPADTLAEARDDFLGMLRSARVSQ